MKPPKEIYYVVISDVGFILEGEVPSDLKTAATIYSARPRWTEENVSNHVPGQIELDLED